MNDDLILEIVRLVRKRIFAHDSCTHGYCKVGSIALAKLLHERGINTIMIRGCFHSGRHWWLRLEDGRYCDCTIDQFEGHEDKEYFLGGGEDIDDRYGYSAEGIESEEPWLLTASLDLSKPTADETAEFKCETI